MNFKAKAAAKLFVLGLAAPFATVLSATPAHAAYSACPAGYFCVWTGPNGTGVMAYYSVADGNLGDASGPTGMNNNIESVRNRTGTRWCLWTEPGYLGREEIHSPGSQRNVYNPNQLSSLKAC